MYRHSDNGKRPDEQAVLRTNLCVGTKRDLQCPHSKQPVIPIRDVSEWTGLQHSITGELIVDAFSSWPVECEVEMHDQLFVYLHTTHRICCAAKYLEGEKCLARRKSACLNQETNNGGKSVHHNKVIELKIGVNVCV